MPELKHLFFQGKMNKDLDERLVPNGEYRDALNISIDISESDEVGTVQNILGNQLLNYKSQDKSTLQYTSHAANLGLTGATCIGSIRHDPSNTIYWFIVDSNGSYIAEYNDSTKIVSAILTDRNNVLNFSTSYLITGINIIDGMLFWTDNNNEPKRINISRFKEGTSDFTTHTQVYGRDFIEHDTTVIKLSPKKAPTMVLDKSKRSGTIQATLVADTVSGATTTFVDSNGDPLGFGESKTIALSTDTNLQIGDILVCTQTGLTIGEIPHIIRLQIDGVQTASNADEVFDVTILSVPEGVSSSDDSWSVKLEEDRAMFEFKFPRFSIRYKYKDGEYSAFGPWTTVAFIPTRFHPAVFKYSPKDGYNLGMVNDVRKITLSNFVATDIPADVVEIDLLYKESNNTLVYTVETIKKDDSVWTSNSYNLESEQIYSVVEANQILRHYDNVPRKALAQELVGNRLVYGNYLQQYNLTYGSGQTEITPVLSLNIIPNEEFNFVSIEDSLIDFRISPFTIYPGKSIKSIRTYQIGIVYLDDLGRKTPVLVNAPRDKGSIGTEVLPKKHAKRYNIIQATAANTPPSWATHYQWYIKEPSNEYYNLALDRWYPAEDGNIWLSFPSSERNKVDEETYLELKKAHDSNIFVEDEARYKILAIENEAPDWITRSFKLLGKLNTDFTSTGFPLIDQNFIEIPSTDWDAGVLADAHELQDLYCRITATGSFDQSGYFEISRIADTGTKYRVQLVDAADGTLAFTSTDGTYAGVSNVSGFRFELYQYEHTAKEEWHGRFFVKVNRDGLLDEHILSKHETQNYITADSKRLFEIKDIERSGDGGDGSSSTARPKEKFWKSEAKHAGLPEDGTKAEWFIDRMNTRHSGAGSEGFNTHGLPSFNLHEEKKATDHANHPPEAFGDDVQHVGRGILALEDRIAKSGCEKHPNKPQGQGDVIRIKDTSYTSSVSDNKVEKYMFIVDHNPGSFNTNQLLTGAIVEDVGEKSNGGKFLDIGRGLMTSGNWDIAKQRFDDGHYDDSTLTFNHDKDNKANKIDISWHWLGEDNPRNWKHEGRSEWEAFPNATEPNEVAFVNAIESPGTLIRFPEDPEYPDNVYQVKYTYRTNILNYDDANTAGKRPPSRRVRFTIALCNPDNPDEDKNITWSIKNSQTDTKSGTSLSGISDLDGEADRFTNIEIVERDFNLEDGQTFMSKNPAIFETEPKEDLGLDLYYAADDIFPILKNGLIISGHSSIPSSTTLTGFSNKKPFGINISTALTDTLPANTLLTFTSPTGSYSFQAQTGSATNSGAKTIDILLDYEPTIYNQSGTLITTPNEYNIHGGMNILNWFNCYSFNNGIESDRIRDDFNQVRIDKGPTVSSVPAEQYKEERRSSGLIYSEIFNSISGINRLNQFNQALKITKDLNPIFGSIQKLHARDLDVVSLCEDKVVQILANKDALYNADGNPQLVATNRVLGAARPMIGEYGISTNPESFASYGFRAYFTDKSRGVVLRLSRDGLTEISGKGMNDYFSDNLAAAGNIIGSYDDDSNSYVLSLNDDTAIYKESIQGWPTRMSFIPESGVSLNNVFYTFKNGQIYSHDNTTRNTFYGTLYKSSIKLIINQTPSKIKNFKTLFYEGSEGWTAPTIETDQQSGQVLSFDEKEGIYYNWIKGVETTWNNTAQSGSLDTKEFSVQGIDLLSSFTIDTSQDFTLNVDENND
mgnify:CR=1 FL=1